MQERRVLLELRNELVRRSAPGARELLGKVDQRLSGIREASPWYQRGSVWFGDLVVAGFTQGIFNQRG